MRKNSFKKVDRKKIRESIVVQVKMMNEIENKNLNILILLNIFMIFLIILNN